MAQMVLSTTGIRSKKSTRPAPKRPRLYHCVFLNDDFTEIGFVVSILQEIFHYTVEEAVDRAVQAHRLGRSIVATYPKEVAEEKANLTMESARSHGFPLRVDLEKQNDP